MAGRSVYVVFVDLGAPPDGHNVASRAAASVLEALQARRSHLVVCSSGTRPEVEVIASELELREPFIVENGGGILIPAGYFPFSVEASKRKGIYDVIRLGAPYKSVVAGLRRAAQASGCPVRSFYDMSVTEVAELFRIDRERAARAKEREYDEPFEPRTDNSTTISALLEFIGKEGLSWVRGPRLYHARGQHNKGQAAQILADLYRRLRGEIVTVGIGYGPHDLSLFERVDVPIMLRPGKQRWDEAIRELFRRSDAAD